MMKRLLGFLLALMMLMTCALAEDQDVNHLLEMCRRVDLQERVRYDADAQQDGHAV